MFNAIMYRKMQQLQTELKEKYAQLEKFLQNAPDGEIEEFRKNKRPFYMHITWKAGKRNYKYIRKKNTQQINVLARKSYYKELQPVLQNNIELIDAFIEKYIPDYEDYALNRIPFWRAELVGTKNQFIKKNIDRWQNTPYEENPYLPENRKIPTMRGEKVRSKDERDIADSLFRAGIAYKTDYPVADAYGNTIYADFVIMHPETMELYYWEHAGLLENTDYVNHNYNRMSRYAGIGILPGDRLIITGSTQNYPLSTARIEMIINSYFL